MPERIQRSRAKGWRMPTDTIYVGRGSKWGNPFTFENSGHVHPALRFACEVAPLLDVTPLRGKNLACWCALDVDCHADVLIELANDTTVIAFPRHTVDCEWHHEQVPSECTCALARSPQGSETP